MTGHNCTWLGNPMWQRRCDKDATYQLQMWHFLINICGCWTVTKAHKSKFPSLTYHADTEGKFYCFFNLGARYGWVVNATPWALYHRGMNRYPFYRRLVGPQDLCGKFYPYRDSILGTSSAQRVAISAMQSRTLTVVYIGNYSMGEAFGSEYLDCRYKKTTQVRQCIKWWNPSAAIWEGTSAQNNYL